jgi:hypothetical protein
MGGDRYTPVPGGLLQPLDEPGHFIPGELSGRLPLGEPQWATSIPEVGVAGIVEQAQQLLHLSGRRRRS